MGYLQDFRRRNVRHRLDYINKESALQVYGTWTSLDVPYDCIAVFAGLCNLQETAHVA